MSEVLLTHRGWLLLCPIYAGDLDSEAPGARCAPEVAGLADGSVRRHL